MVKIVVAYDSEGDWAGLYVDGRLKKEDHSFTPSEVLKALNIPHEVKYVDVNPETGRFDMWLKEDESKHPDWKPITYDHWMSDYSVLVDSWNLETLVYKTSGGYQGDDWYLLYDKKTDMYGYLSFGWGSCSGCDALQACNSQYEVEQLRESLYNNIVWKPLKDMFLWFKSHDWEGDYTWTAAEHHEFRDLAMIALSDRLKDEYIRSL